MGLWVSIVAAIQELRSNGLLRSDWPDGGTQSSLIAREDASIVASVSAGEDASVVAFRKCPSTGCYQRCLGRSGAPPSDGGHWLG